MWLLANWKILVTVAGTLSLSWMLHTLDVHRIEARQVSEIATVKTAMAAECNKAQETTRKVSHDYQTKLAALDARLSAARRMHDNRCMSVTGIPATGHHAGTAGGKLSGRDVEAAGLIDLAGRAERVRIQLIACQGFIGAERSQ